MAGDTMNKALISLALPLLALLTACNMGAGGNASSGESEQGNLVGARIGAPFTLTDQDGKTVHWDDYKGQYRIVYFGYTYCPDVCPVDLQRIMQAFSAFEKAAPARAAKVQPIFISVDPKRDTPAVLKPYVAAFHPRLVGLTGTPEQIAKVAKDFVVLYNAEKPEGASDYLVSHSRTPYLFGPDGKPIALVPVDDPGTPDVDEGAPDIVRAFLEKWVK
ncbi:MULTISPECIES: SCO family protein [Sphingobium]|jgi:protein SCO1|uniref:SCO family protein n=2 Tax=Sphingobium yanoikuyae TaxID=13690 RepID=A0A085K5A8_SPHYA|nr:MULTISPECIES: SCO family protein [Sphingobium]RSU76235.1 SCO family protein [Sphingomonas sp. S-NIH.Pt3_0716]ATI82256.1 SCO family protein [Sphingobium yanoikuyae]AYO79314.1 SCO family protein [Sphingobium yanoikuyae]KFD27904.1 electron transporter [Sphingobium yanoikuyae]KZC79500.1 electron transporter [Sphingobium yanoikuyae]